MTIYSLCAIISAKQGEIGDFLIDYEVCEAIIEKYYSDIFKFCMNDLHDKQAAEDCTQEVFLLLFQKREKLDFTEKLRSWLYDAALRICKNYRKKHNPNTVNIDDYAEQIPDTDKQMFLKEIYEVLGADDAEFYLEYSEADQGQRKKIAKKMGITVKALYRRADRIREKLMKYFGDI